MLFAKEKIFWQSQTFWSVENRILVVLLINQPALEQKADESNLIFSLKLLFYKVTSYHSSGKTK